MHDGMPYGRNQGQRQGHSREVDRQSPTGLIFIIIIQVLIHDTPNVHHLCSAHTVMTTTADSSFAHFYLLYINKYYYRYAACSESVLLQILSQNILE